MRSRPFASRASNLVIMLLSLTLCMAAQQKPRVPTQQELTQLDAVLDASPNIGHLFRANPVKLVEPSVIAKNPSLQTLFKQNPDLVASIGRYKNAFQQREFRFAYGEAETAMIPRTAMDWFDSYITSTPAIAAALKKSPAAIDDASVINDPVLLTFLKTYPTFSTTLKKHPVVFLSNPDFFKYYR
jgi:hypothetical protein